MSRRWLILAAVGLVLFVIGLLVDARPALLSYLAAYAAAWSIAVGALILVMACNITGARWFAPFRPFAETVAASGPLFAVLFLQIAIGLPSVYPWATLDTGDRSTWLDPAFFLVRAAVYFAIWIAVGLLLRRWSPARAAEPGARPDGRTRALSAGALPAVALALSFAAFDWLMSLAPRWFSTIYGVYVFAGGFLAALALLAVALPWAALDDYQKLGNLMLTFVVFWAYIAFSQFFIIWIADVPQEVAWYVPRIAGSWGWLALLVLVGQFALPFLLLLLRGVKRWPGALAVIGGWLLAMHYLDVYWLVLPQLHPGGIGVHWLDLAGIALVAGAALAWVEWQLGHGAAGLQGSPAASPHARPVQPPAGLAARSTEP
jgi:hypothetical protein